jgi:hypothetical protein
MHVPPPACPELGQLRSGRAGPGEHHVNVDTPDTARAEKPAAPKEKPPVASLPAKTVAAKTTDVL